MLVTLPTLIQGIHFEYANAIAAIPIRAMAYDSRQVQPGTLFIAIKGFHTDGHLFIDQALARGAAAVVYEDSAWDGHIAVPALRVHNARTALASIAAAYYAFPAAALRVIGITGTDGKTTTTMLTSVALEAGGHTTGLMGTVDFKIAGRLWANESRQSTPEAPEVQAMLREMVSAGCSHSVLEATSHALSAQWNRLGGCLFDVAVLTNVTHEHLDYHGSVEQYRRDKARLFEMLGEQLGSELAGATHALGVTKTGKRAIVNADDPHHAMFLEAAPASAQRLSYAVHHPADIRATDIMSTRDGLRFTVHTPWGMRPVSLQLTGDFNVHNSLAALTVALSEGVDIDAALAALAGVPGVRGRMERIEAGQAFTVLVDYAHTPGSFEKLMSIVRPLTTGRLIAVFGSAGERDREKRPLQGAMAARYCDLIVVTDEDPRLEDRHAILQQIADGAEAEVRRSGRACECWQIADRRAALRAAFEAARAGDIVLLLGKGHEGSIIYADGKMAWDEAAEARAALSNLL